MAAASHEFKGRKASSSQWTLPIRALRLRALAEVVFLIRGGLWGALPAWLSLSARHNGAHKVASWLKKRTQTLTSSKFTSFLGALRGDALKARGSSREPAGGQPPRPSRLGLQRRPGPPGRWKGACPQHSTLSVVSASSPVWTLLPTVLPQGEERAQLPTELPRDMVAAGCPPHNHTENSSHVCWPNCALWSWCRLPRVPRGAAEEPGDFWWPVWSSRYPRWWLNRTLLGQLRLRRQWWQTRLDGGRDGRRVGFSTHLSPKMLQMDSFFSLKRGLSGICDLFWDGIAVWDLERPQTGRRLTSSLPEGEGLSVQTALDSRGHLSWPALPSRGFLVFT